MASSNSPCAACKVRRCKCTQECVFAPYFPPDQPQKFANVHNVFGASNVAKLLIELDARHREDAVNSLVYEAEFRLRDPVYGCVGLISLLQQTLKQKQSDLANAKEELAGYIGPQAMLPVMQPSPMMMAQQQHPGNPSSSSGMPYNMQHMMPYNPPAGPSGKLIIREAPQQHQQLQLHQQQLFEAQQLAAALAAREQQDMYRALEEKEQQMNPSHHQPQLQQQEFLRLHNRFDPSSSSASGFNQLNNPPPLEQKELQTDPRHHPQLQQQELLRLHSGFDPSPVSASGFNQLNNASSLFPSLALGTFDHTYDVQPESSEHPHSHYHHQQQQELLLLQAQPFLQPQQELLQAQPLLQPQQQQLQAQPLLQTQQQPQPPTQSQLLQQEKVDNEDDRIMRPSGSG